MDLNLEQLKSFYEIAKSGSFTAATKRLRTTQPALSRSIKNLEESVGYTVFERHARGIRLTAEGSIILEHCHSIFRECESIVNLKRNESKSLRISASENLCIRIFPTVLMGIIKSERHLQFAAEFSSGTAEEVVRNVSAAISEIGYCFHTSKISGISFTPICLVEFVLVAKPILVREAKLSFKRLSGSRYIGSRVRDYQGKNLARGMLAELGTISEAAVQCNSQEAQVQFALSGVGYTLVPRFLVQPYLEQKRLSIIATPSPIQGTIYRAIQSAKQLTTFEKNFEAGMKAVLEIGSN